MPRGRPLHSDLLRVLILPTPYEQDRPLPNLRQTSRLVARFQVASLLQRTLPTH
jgi:hypothetical protein